MLDTLNDKVQGILEAAGIKDYDDLKDFEKDTYFKMLEVAEKGKITLEDVKKHIKRMREGVEYSLATEKLSKAEDLFLKARLKNYILMEGVFDRPERARDMLDQYSKGVKTKV